MDLKFNFKFELLSDKACLDKSVFQKLASLPSPPLHGHETGTEKNAYKEGFFIFQILNEFNTKKEHLFYCSHIIKNFQFVSLIFNPTSNLCHKFSTMRDG